MPVPLAERVVEVIAQLCGDTGPRHRYGSGCIVRGRTVLTAAHIIAGARAVQVRRPDKSLRPARVDPRFIGRGAGPDLALIDIADTTIDLSPIEIAVVDRDSSAGVPVEGCHAVGYPWFAEKPSPSGVRDTVDAWGHIPVLSNLATGLLTVQVTASPRPLPPQATLLSESEWSGMSGAPVIAGGCLVGVVSEHRPREGPSAITAVPLTALERDRVHPGWGPGVENARLWWARLGVSGVDALERLPIRHKRVEPAYWATVREIHQRTRMLIGRDGDLADIDSFAMGTECYRWLVGKTYAGKTSLLAEAAAGLRGRTDVISYFLSRREADADSSRFLAAVVPQLAYLLDEDPPVAELQQFRALWERAAKRADRAGRHLLLIVDGLDEDLRPPRLPSVAAILPEQKKTDSKVHVLVSSRPYPELPYDILPSHPLVRVSPVTVKPFVGAQERSALARQEIDELVRRDSDGLAADIFGLLAAAAGPLAVTDLAALTVVAPSSSALTRRIRELLTVSAARSLQPVRSAEGRRYQFAHESLLEYAQTNDDLNDPEFRHRIHRWAQKWRSAGWPPAVGGEQGTPRYLLDTYPSTLVRDRQRLADLMSDVSWIDRAIQSVGVEQLLTDLRRTVAADPDGASARALLRTVTYQAYRLQMSTLLSQPGYVLRQLCLQAIELSEGDLASELHIHLRSRAGPQLIPIHSTHSAICAAPGATSHHGTWALAVAVLPDRRVVFGGDDGRVLLWDPRTEGGDLVELGGHSGSVLAAAALPDGRVITGGDDGRVLVWDPGAEGDDPVELGRHRGWVRGMTLLPDGRVITGGYDGRVLMWESGAEGCDPVELGRHSGSVLAAAALPDGRVITGGDDGRLLVWDQGAQGDDPVELGRHTGSVKAAAVLPGGRVITGGGDGRLLVWDQGAQGGDPVELGRGSVRALAVLPDGRVVVGGDVRVLVGKLGQDWSSFMELGCSGTALAAECGGDGEPWLVIAHQGMACSVWSVER